jgi:putative peptide zinc metalloprotease protein
VSPLCPDCRRYVARDEAWCTTCGRPLHDDAPPLELVLEDGTRVPLTDTVTLGRAPGNGIRFTDPSVSRQHACVLGPSPQRGPVLQDAGSSSGTWLDGRRVEAPAALHDGAAIGLGDSRLTVERRRLQSDPGRTIVVRAGLTLVVGAGDAARAPAAVAAGGATPRVRSGWALKRLQAAEGDQRWILRDAGGSSALRFGDAEADLFELLDGRRSLADLIAAAERLHGPAGIAVLARLLADLGEHGLLAGVETSRGRDDPGRLRRLLKPRELCAFSPGAFLEQVYRGGGWVLFTRAGLLTLTALAMAGLVALGLVIARGDTTPFVVSSSVGLGALAYILGRLAVVLVHELAHGLALVAVGRRPSRWGLKFVLGFPYAFVDTSDALFEPRRRRIAVSAAGPAADLVVGGAFALLCGLTARGVGHDIAFQIALSAYTGAVLNLNPLLDRDGYHILVDWLAVPNLRLRAREWMARRGEHPGPVAWYALASAAWSALVAALAILLSLRYADDLTAIAPEGIAWALLAAFWSLVLLPVAAALAGPALRRVRAARGSSG